MLCGKIENLWCLESREHKLDLGTLNSGMVRADDEQAGVILEFLIIILISSRWPSICCVGLDCF